MNLPLPKLLVFGFITELLILIVSYLLHLEIENTFRYAARYSGRLSAFIFLCSFFLFTKRPSDLANNNPALNFIKLFAFLHIIHFVFLGMSVYLNSIPLETVKVIGGTIAYAMIIISPFKLHSLKTNYQLVYFYYVSLVMLLTYVARIKGDFPGAEPFWFHYVMFGFFIISAIVFSVLIRRSINKTRY